ncbi:glutathione ABC transporter substrate-binding protein [Alkalicoccobacillus murimartini]|uniref:Peptide/nickel transport system substrate-binding protein n=1 Tax=Alkalicoccobacillus murimartini TaxID=171685 RepID=A0ABT9YNW0_9BACI|nr:glutathione ABC transporter substrate-binding protein [Alkalicoccobacillus murimartini]MDQ0209334.1 peptide/nickel transport system substrate-binding protein [Alkalicoccobacillus murimartini]
MENFKKRYLFSSVLALTVFLGACASEPTGNGGDSGTDDDGETADNGGTEGGDLIISLASDAVSLDLHGSNDTYSSNVASNIYETLVFHDKDLELQDGLAESHEQLDANTWVFNLREGVTFHDGSEFNAEVVKANLDRILDPAIASQRAFLYDMIEEVEIIDDYTVEITTEYPFAPLPAHLAHNGGGMMSGEMIAADYEAMENGEEPGSVINQEAIGTGYFKFDSWSPGNELKIVKNEDYWGDAAKVDSVTFRVVPEDGTRIADLNTGAAHIADPLSPSDVSQIEATEGMYIESTESVAMMYIGFNSQKEPFDDPNVRKALSMAINKQSIIDGIYDGHGLEAKSPLAPKVYGYSEDIDVIEYDPEEAKSLLAEAGYNEGDLSITFNTSDHRERQSIAENVQQALSEIGVTVNIEMEEWGSFLESTANGEQEMFVLSWSTVTGDGDYGLFPLFHESQHGSAGNRTFTDDAELNDLLMGARQNENQEERLDQYLEAQNIIADEAIVLPLFHEDYLLGVSDSVEGLWQHPTRRLMLQDVTLN